MRLGENGDVKMSNEKLSEIRNIEIVLLHI